MKWLFATTTPWPMTNGTALRVWHICRQLRRLGEEVSLVAEWDGDFEQAYGALGVQVRAVKSGGTGSARRPTFSPFDTSAVLAAAIAGLASDFDAVVLAGMPVLQYASYADASFVVADIIDDAILALRRRLWRGRSPLTWARQLRLLVELGRHEAKHVNRVRLASFVSPADSRSFGRRHPACPVVTCPNGVDIEHFSTVACASPADDPSVLFVGNYSFAPNSTAARFLCERIAPLVWQRLPSVRFDLVGPDPTEEMRAASSDRVNVTGAVADVRPFLQRARAVAIPMVIGTGIKNKFLEAWAAARAVVATPLACQGLPVEDEGNALVGETAEAFAAKLCRVLNDDELRRRIARAGRDVAAERFDWSVTTADFRRAVLAAMSSRSKRWH